MIFAEFDWNMVWNALGVVLTVVVPALAVYVASWLKAKAEAIKVTTQFDNNQILKRKIEDVKEFISNKVMAKIQTNYIRIAKDVVANLKDGMPMEDIKVKVKQDLYSLGTDLKAEVKNYATNLGQDVLSQLSDELLNSLVEKAVNDQSPFPGQETTEALVKSAETIVKDGIQP